VIAGPPSVVGKTDGTWRCVPHRWGANPSAISGRIAPDHSPRTAHLGAAPIAQRRAQSQLLRWRARRMTLAAVRSWGGAKPRAAGPRGHWTMGRVCRVAFMPERKSPQAARGARRARRFRRGRRDGGPRSAHLAPSFLGGSPTQSARSRRWRGSLRIPCGGTQNARRAPAIDRAPRRALLQRPAIGKQSDALLIGAAKPLHTDYRGDRLQRSCQLAEVSTGFRPLRSACSMVPIRTGGRALLRRQGPLSQRVDRVPNPFRAGMVGPIARR